MWREGDLIAHVKSTDLDIQQSQLENQLAIYQTQLSQYNKLIQSIQDNTNYFSESDPADQTYYYQYENYQSQVAQHTFDSSAYRAAGYTEAQIQSMMEQNQSELEQIYYSALQSAAQNVSSVQANIENLQSQLDALSTGANDYYIYAPTSGVIHMDTPYSVGMVLSAGSVLATVASENSDYEIVAYASLSDRPLLDVGDPCTIAITGLAQTAYGTLTGTVTAIDSDVTTSNGTSFYKVTVQSGQHLPHQQERRSGGSLQRHERHRPRPVRRGDLLPVCAGGSGRPGAPEPWFLMDFPASGGLRLSPRRKFPCSL